MHTPTQTTSLVDWSRIKHVLLDMDGTLLDLRFDNHFWLEVIPETLSARDGKPKAQAKAEFLQHCDEIRGTLDWYCLDYWTRRLDLDVVALKEGYTHLINEHPHVIEFLQAVRASGRRAVLVTNAHRGSVNLKLRHTTFAEHLDKIVSAHDLGYPKEAQDFWHALQQEEPFQREHALLVDDSLAVLRSAHQYGIGQLLSVAKPDTQQPAQDHDEFPHLQHFADIMPPEVL